MTAQCYFFLNQLINFSANPICPYPHCQRSFLGQFICKLFLMRSVSVSLYVDGKHVPWVSHITVYGVGNYRGWHPRHTSLFTHTHTNTNTYIYTYVHVYMHAYIWKIRTYIHIYTYTYVYMYVCMERDLDALRRIWGLKPYIGYQCTIRVVYHVLFILNGDVQKIMYFNTFWHSLHSCKMNHFFNSRINESS